MKRGEIYVAKASLPASLSFILPEREASFTLGWRHFPPASLGNVIIT